MLLLTTYLPTTLQNRQFTDKNTIDIEDGKLHSETQESGVRDAALSRAGMGNLWPSWSYTAHKTI